tara:strand:- start:38 stop:328 length:291 start_codon:yes stop_codon:yes gene_type:complete
VSIFTVCERVVEGNAHGLAIDLKGHGFRSDSCHLCCRCGCLTSVVVCVAKYSITVIVIHVTTDAFADGWSERIGGHGKEARMKGTKSAEALPEQEG